LQAALPPIPSLFPPAGPAAYLALTMVRPLCPPVQLTEFARGKEKKKKNKKQIKKKKVCPKLSSSRASTSATVSRGAGPMLGAGQMG